MRLLTTALLILLATEAATAKEGWVGPIRGQIVSGEVEVKVADDGVYEVIEGGVVIRAADGKVFIAERAVIRVDRDTIHFVGKVVFLDSDEYFRGTDKDSTLVVRKGEKISFGGGWEGGSYPKNPELKGR